MLNYKSQEMWCQGQIWSHLTNLHYIHYLGMKQILRFIYTENLEVGRKLEMEPTPTFTGECSGELRAALSALWLNVGQGCLPAYTSSRPHRAQCKLVSHRKDISCNAWLRAGLPVSMGIRLFAISVSRPAVGLNRPYVQCKSGITLPRG
jgi:hypothetical protein